MHTTPHLFKAFFLSVCLTISFPAVATLPTPAQDSIRQLQIDDLCEQIRWVNPTALRAYLGDIRPLSRL